ncbi:7973_t:CDS:1, partial [Dentiscutata heterogama]
SPENSEHFKPEIEEEYEPGYENEGNRAIYHREAKAFSQSQISENGKTGQLLRYFGGDYLTELPTHDNIVAENDE